MSDPTYTALRAHHRTVEAMLADPQCTGDLLLVGMAVSRHVHLRLARPEDEAADLTWGDLCRPFIRESRNGAWWLIKSVLQKDIRRYDAFEDNGGHYFEARCGSPMIRRHGPCGQSASIRAMVADPETGRRSWLAACRRHREWFDHEWAKSRQVEPAREPAANAGGVLERHIPQIDWHYVWKQVDPNWTPPPEGEETTARPKLRLIVGSTA